MCVCVCVCACVSVCVCLCACLRDVQAGELLQKALLHLVERHVLRDCVEKRETDTERKREFLSVSVSNSGARK